MRPLFALSALLLAAGPALAQDTVGFDLSSFGKVVLSRNQVAAGDIVNEVAFEAYNNEFISAYSPNSFFARIGRSVGRLDVATDTGVFPCTAFLVDDDLIMTNNHCVPGILDNPKAKATTIVGVQFVLGYTHEGVTEGTRRYTVDPTPVETSKDLDYTLLRVLGDKPGQDFGTLALAALTPNDNDPYLIIGHPMGESQRISREKCRANSPALSDGQLLHTCDTLPGNSGSPVIDADTRRVIGLHHAGSANNSVNYAIPMTRILANSALLAALVPPADTGPATTAPDPEAQAITRLSQALAILDTDERLIALETLVLEVPGTSAARTAGQLIAALQKPNPEPEQPRGPAALADRMAENAEVQACDRIAGDMYHPDRAAGLMLQPGVRFDDIDAEPGIAACLAALDAFPNHPRLTAFLAEALTAAKRYDEALPIYRAAAEAGDPIGQAGLGVAYLQGNGVDIDYAAAHDWLSRATDLGYPIAESGLGEIYRHGLGVPASETLALAHIMAAAERDYYYAQKQLGDMYARGEIVEKSPETAAYWYAKSAAQNFAEAQYALGTLYAEGLGVTRSDAAAAELFRLAAEQGHAPAQLMLANIHVSGRGVVKSYETAAKWFTAAADQGDPAAQYNLANLHAAGLGVDKSLETAVALYTQSAEQGYAFAQEALGTHYLQGLGVAQSDSDAALWYGRAAAQGLKNSLVTLGWMHETGRGMDKDADKAADFYLRSLAAGSPWAAERRAGDWPRDTVFALQRALSAKGVYSGGITGQVGPQTQEAMRALLPR
ncbi:trypsin-like peptidase domain-containing protein [Maliponia aquimaris]|uniref:Serine protease n=1 Tax=Maliponia aquimaris TaxID=1673631 RepID=A0A238K652_9RHOB|nr:trypsin-like peptidase domain-containing protein [Maliponia aquimaris]SMX38391.1 Putative beta-lactamase HcpC precursor [Maliponia aquimaris]